MRQPSARVHVRAPGKINLALSVGALLDDGYHSLATAFHAVSLYEDVYATHSEGLSISVSGDVDTSAVPLDERNLALRAAHLLAQVTGYEGGVHLEIEKGVPVAGGMGGGSADAAAALVACDALWQTGLTMTQLYELAARLGADVPFSLMGGTAIGRGRGDELTPVLARGRFDWVLATSTEGLSTPTVYSELDRLRDAGVSTAPFIPAVGDELLRALRAGDPRELALELSNDLQDAAFALRPELGQLRALGLSFGALAGIVSGSGPTVAFLCADADEAHDLHVSLSASGHTTFTAQGPVPGARIID